ncbi:MAG TPA: nitroreductase family protein [Burkholderiales bacterium]
MPSPLADLIEARFGLPTDVGRNVPAEGMLASLLAHSSCREFGPAPVPQDLLDLLLACAFSAPSKSDLQQCSIVVVRDAGKRAAIQSRLPSMPWIAGAPVLLIVCGDHRRTRRIAMLRGKPFPNDSLDMFMNAAVDAGIVLATLVAAAEAAGLGTCPLSMVRNHVHALSRELELPPHVFPVAGLALGHPAKRSPVSLRLPLAMTVHTDRYDDDKFETLLADYDRRREAARPTPAAKQRDVARHGSVEIYSWSEDKARQYSTPERADFGDYVRGQEFGLK